MVKQIGNPELLETWGSEGTVSEPFLSKKRQGWLFEEQPASSIANWLVNVQQQKINHLLKNGVSQWTTNTDYTRGAIVKHANTAWKALRDNTASEPAPPNEDWAEVSTLPILRRPVLESPIDGASGVATAAPLEASPYAPVYSVDTRDYRRFEVDVSGGDFSSPVVTNEVDADDWTVDPALTTSTGYIWRCKDVSIRGDESDWSDVEGFVTGTVFVTTPSITAPADNAVEIGETPTFESSAFAVTGGSDTHVASFWRVFQGATEVWSSGRTIGDLESITIPSGILVDGETEYTVQVRHEGDDFGTSAWSAASTFTTLDSFTRVATPSITSPSQGETEITETPTFASSAFSVINGSDTHVASVWEVYDSADALVWSSGRTTVERTAITIPSGILQDGETTYKVRVRHEGDTLGNSEWSALVSFVTQDSFVKVFAGLFGQETKKISATSLSLDSTYSGNTGIVAASAFGSGFLFVADGSTVRKINPDTMAQAAAYTGHTSGVTSLAYGTDGFLYSGSGGSVRKLDPSDMSLSASFTGVGASGVNALTYGDDGFVYAAEDDDFVRKIDPDTMTQSATYQSEEPGVNFISLAFGSDGFLYAGANNNDDFGNIGKINPSTMGFSDNLNGLATADIKALVFGSDGNLYAGTGSTVEKINPATMSVSQTFASAGTGDVLTFGSDGFVYSGGTDNAVRKIDPADMTEADSILLASDVTALAFNISIPDLLGFTA